MLTKERDLRSASSTAPCSPNPRDIFGFDSENVSLLILLLSHMVSEQTWLELPTSIIVPLKEFLRPRDNIAMSHHLTYNYYKDNQTPKG